MTSTARQHYAAANATQQPRVPTWIKGAVIIACIGLGGALDVHAQTIGVHVAHKNGAGISATPGAYIIDKSGLTAGVIIPRGDISKTTVYAGMSVDLLRVGPAVFGAEAGVSHQHGKLAAYAMASVRMSGVRLFWSPVVRVAGMSVEF